jgi:hypothetical protein
MTTCLDIITKAYAKARVRARGDDLDAEEASAGLVSLESLFAEMAAEGVFGRLTDVIVSADYTAGEQERIFNTDPDGDAAVFTITLPKEITDADEDAGVRPPRDLTLVQVVGSGATTRVYSRGSWVALDSLTLAGTCPLAERGADGLACLLAAYIAEENGKPVGSITAMRGMAFRSRLTHRADSTRQPLAIDYF